MPELTVLVGFREDTLEMEFEQPWRLSFTLVDKRADDTPLDTNLIWTYTINGTVRLKGYLRTLEEQLSPEEDFQRYELTDLLADVWTEPFLRERHYPEITGDFTARFTFNDTKYPGIEQTVEDAINVVAGISSIVTGVNFVDPVPAEELEQNIPVEARGIGEFISSILKFSPSWRFYYDSNSDELKFVDLDVLKPKEVRLSKIYGKWHLRSPKWNNLVRFDVRIDKTDCYEKVRFEGLGIFQYRCDVELEQGWYSPCVPDKYKAPCYALVEPYFPDQVADCPMFATRYLFPTDVRVANIGFREEDGGVVTAIGESEVIIKANIPQRNLGRCKTAADFDGGVLPPDINPICQPQDNPWGWADFELIEIGKIAPPTEKNKCGELEVNFSPRRLMSMLPFYSPATSPDNVDDYPPDPKILPWEVFACFWEDLGPLVVEKTGGCPNGRVYQRYNTDWAKVIREDGTIAKDDLTFLNDFADKLLEQIGVPKVSGEIEIHLHPRDTGTGNESYDEPDFVPYIDYLGIELGDSINIIYDPAELFGTEPYPDGKGILPDADPLGGDLTWETMNLRVMGMSFNRINQSLVLRVANSAYISGDRAVDNFQR